MINTKAFGDILIKAGFNFFAGVPCSYQTNLINYAINNSSFIMSSNEGDAIASCSGAYYAGKNPIVLMQNSGLGNAVSPLTSLNGNYGIPLLGFISLRGEKGEKDEPQHKLMGKITLDLLDLMEIDWEFLNKDQEEAEKQVLIAKENISKGKSFFFIIRKNSFSELNLVKKSNDSSSEITRGMAIKAIANYGDENTVLVATTGKTGRELFQLSESPNNFYMTGSMGCLSSFSFGIALNSKKNVIAIDGDGSLIMRLGNLSTIGFYSPSNLLHILLDNSSHDSTGGQFTTGSKTNFIELAKNTNYKKCLKVDSIKDLDKSINKWIKNPELTFLHLEISKGSIENLGRPTLTPEEISTRFKKNFDE